MTGLHRFLWALSTLLCLGVSVAQGQNRLYADRGGDDGTANDCQDAANPCTFTRAVTQAANNDTVAVRVSAEGGTADVRGGHGLVLDGKSIALSAYERSAPETNVAGLVVVEGDVSVANGQVFVNEGLALGIRSNRVRLNGSFDAPALVGSFVVGSRSNAVTIELTGSCTAVEDITITGDVIVEGACTTSASLSWLSGTQFRPDPGLGVTGSLEVSSGSLKLDDRLALHIVSAVPASNSVAPATVKIAEGASIEGSGFFQLAVEGGAWVPSSSTAIDCYVVGGGGQLRMDFYKSTDATVCLDLNRVDGSSTSYNVAGELLVRNATTFEGSFDNEGLAQTRFWKLTSLDGDLGIRGGNDVLSAAGTSCLLEEYPGVHLFKGTTISGSVEIIDSRQSSSDDQCYAQLVLRGVANPTDPGSGNVGAKESQVTTVKGHLYTGVRDLSETDGGGTVHMDDHDFYHNLALEGNVVVADGYAEFLMQSPALVPGSRGASNPVGEGMDYCTGTIDRAVGNMLILSGERTQRFEVLDDDETEVPAVRVNKPGGTVLLSGRAGLSIDFLELESGRFVTGTAEEGGLLSLDELVLNHDSGTGGAAELVKAGGQEELYAAGGRPSIVVYKGTASQVIGEEIGIDSGGDSELERLAIAKSEDAVVELTHPLTIDWQLDLVSGQLVLHRVDDAVGTGWLEPERSGATLSFTDDAAYIEVVDGDIAYPDDRGMHGSLVVLDEDPTLAPTLRYAGASDRLTGNIWPSFPSASTSLRFAPVLFDVRVASSCEQNGAVAHPVISLGPGFTTVSSNTLFTILNGALDIAGQVLALYSLKTDNERQRIEIHPGGQLCDSGAGQSCARRTSGMSGSAVVRHLDMRAAEAHNSLPELPSGEFGVEEIFERGGAIGLAEEVDSPSPRKRPHFNRDRAPLVQMPRERPSLAAKGTERNLHLQQVVKADNAPGWLVLGRFTSGGQHRFTIYVDNEDLVVSVPRLWLGSESVLFTANTRTPVTTAGAGDRITTLDTPGIYVERGTVTFGSFLDRVRVAGDFTMSNGSVSVRRPDALSGIPRQELLVGGDYVQEDGSVNMNCNVLDIGGGFWLDEPQRSDGSFRGTDATFQLGQAGLHKVNGPLFHVGPDDAADDPNVYRLGGNCTSPGTPIPEAAPVGLHVAGNYRFLGTGDVSDASGQPTARLGLRGGVTFAGDGTKQQSIVQAEKPDAQFGDVTIATTGAGINPVVMASNIKQNVTGTLTLRRGHIKASDPEFEWRLLNPAAETIPRGHYTPEEGSGAVNVGSRRSYVMGVPVARAIAGDQATGGLVRSGFVFPTGSGLDPDRDTDYFRPLTLQFLDNVDTSLVSVQMVSLPRASLAWPEENIIVGDTSGSTLELNDTADVFWRVRFDEPPPHDPNVRVAVEGLPNVYRTTGLRLVQWDCDRTDPRAAGIYDLSRDPTDDDSFMLNDWINGVPNISQEGVEFGTCTIIGIAANHNENPISLPVPVSGFSRVQLINSVVGASLFDIYVDDRKVADDWGFQQATSYLPVAAGVRTLAVTDAEASDHSAPLFTTSLGFSTEKHYSVLIHGSASNIGAAMVEDTRMAAEDAHMVDFFVLHGAPELGPVDIRLLDWSDNVTATRLLANNLEFGDAGQYVSLPEGRYNLEVTSANNDRRIEVYRLELDEYEGSALVLNLSGPGKAAADGLTVMGVSADGSTFFPSVVTNAAFSGALPAEFTLHGNYPNPFNPSTTIAFDLPETAEVTVQVIDLLGRQVYELPARQVDAGAGQTLTLSPSSLASGTYVYRIVAESESRVMTRMGRMVLVK